MKIYITVDKDLKIISSFYPNRPCIHHDRFNGGPFRDKKNAEEFLEKLKIDENVIFMFYYRGHNRYFSYTIAASEKLKKSNLYKYHEIKRFGKRFIDGLTITGDSFSSVFYYIVLKDIVISEMLISSIFSFLGITKHIEKQLLKL